MAVKDYSTTPASNASVGSVNFAEGQAPSTVNNSARQVMADIAAYRDAINHSTGSFATAGGSSNAFTLTVSTELTPSAYAHGQMFGFRANHSITGAATLNVNSIGAVAIQFRGSALVSGDINSGDLVLVRYESVTPAFQMLSPPRLSVLPAATTSVSGVVELATNAEVNTGTDTSRAVVPASIAQIISGATAETAPAIGDSVFLYDASATANRQMTLENVLKVVNGLTEDTSPANSSDFLLSYDTSASAAKKVKPSNLFTSVTASKAQMEAASATDVYPTPSVQHNHPGHPKAWARWTPRGTNGACTVTSSYNVSGVTRDAAGTYTVTFTTAFADTNYCMVGSQRFTSALGAIISQGVPATGSCTVFSVDIGGGAYDSASSICAAFYGDQ